ncbi:MAG: LTA synthase family protein [Flavobacteriaceae bacterium]|nr:LTA synthase family protein [Flavobacteriaceae bacterium]
MLTKIRPWLWEFTVLSSLVFLMLLGLRACEWVMLRNTLNVYPISISNVYNILRFDFQATFIFGLGMLLPFLLAKAKNWNWLKVLTKVFFLLYFFVTMGLTHYFLTTQILLGSNLFEFSLNEIFFITGRELTWGRFNLWLMDILLMGATISFLFFFYKKIAPSKKFHWIFISAHFGLGLCLLLFGHFMVKPLEYFGSVNRFMVCNNKFLYICQSFRDKSLEQKVEEFNPLELSESIRLFQAEGVGKKYIGEQFPLIHETDFSNVLGPYFPNSNQKPNVVFLLCESLSGPICGERAAYRHMMPYFDTLIGQSLYWPHFICSAPQTYGVLPNVLGSLPLGVDQRGFINLEHGQYPNHQTAVSVLNQKGYTTNFFHGGWGHFDHMDNFMKHNQVGHFQAEESFDHRKNEGDANRRWGQPDMETFDKSFQYLNKEAKQPYFNIYLTLTFHSPFNMAPEKYVSKTFVDSRLKAARIERNEHLNREGDQLLGSLFYTDDAIKHFFEEYRKRPDFNNTIFIITGDHGMAMQHSLYERFNVPLIIYSPMLKQPARFGALSTHRDILPSLLALLKNNFGVEVPTRSHWIGSGLDTAKAYRCLKSEQLAMYDEVYPQYLYHDYYIQNGVVFKVDSTFMEKQMNNKAMAIKLTRLAKAADQVNKYTLLNDRIWE